MRSLTLTRILMTNKIVTHVTRYQSFKTRQVKRRPVRRPKHLRISFPHNPRIPNLLKLRPQKLDSIYSHSTPL